MEYVYSIRFKRIKYPTMTSCMTYLKKWDRYNQLISLVDQDLVRFRITSIYIYVYLYTLNNNPDRIKPTSITIHEDVYYHHTRDDIKKINPVPLTCSYFPGFYLARDWPAMFKELDSNITKFSGIYVLAANKKFKGVYHEQIDTGDVDVIEHGNLRLFLLKSDRKKFGGFI